ncbi:FkbM family methyltransferase [Aureibaculum sp. A20]|uniref:FkbM family methyltransferase n=1 Tax=Aureibaculum flavum TaxID=2795986 RepID=A0ABS0WQN5_9FLAO|nr:FkbM family methyltransferase [Aureibaculum flavum]MBJ2174282.1 FkbM family methyltransferase [Aureibaculum flavum]
MIILNTIFKFLFSVAGMNAGFSVSKNELNSFIKNLKPQKTNFELIRLGPEGDGGYLVPNDLENIDACFSPGVDLISDFEQECYNIGMQIYLADKSVDRPNLEIPQDNYHFLKKFIGPINNDDYITMDSWVNSVNTKANSDLLLQMDIEGHEYSSILGMSDELMNRFRIIVIEFHELNKLWNKEFFRIAQAVFTKLLDTHVCVHIHPNNQYGIDTLKGIGIPRIAEFTFLRKDRITILSDAIEIPNKLDFDNTNNKSIVLPNIWYK